MYEGPDDPELGRFSVQNYKEIVVPENQVKHPLTGVHIQSVPYPESINRGEERGCEPKHGSPQLPQPLLQLLASYKRGNPQRAVRDSGGQPLPSTPFAQQLFQALPWRVK